MVLPLERIEVGDMVEVVWIASEHGMARRLKDLGFIPGNEIECVLKGRKRGMHAYLVRNAVIALRASTAREILVKNKLCDSCNDCDN